MSATAPLRDGDPRRVGGYELTARLGRGGQGVVYLGTGPGGDQVAVKLLHRDLVNDAARRAQLAKEVDTARRVARFCTAQVLDADVTGDPPYVVSEFIDGPSLHGVVRDEGPLTGSRLERLAVGTITALAAIHRAGIVHRDFKPGNVLLGPDGPRVIDFGIARALDASTQTSSIVGTPSFMAPEQISGDALGPAADVFAWGSTMVFAATASAPFGQDSLPGVIHRLTSMPPELGALAGPLRSIVERCLAKDAKARPSSAEVLLTVLSSSGPLAPDAPAGAGAGPVPKVTELPMPTLQAGAVAAAGIRPPAPAGPPPVRMPTAAPHPRTGPNTFPPTGPQGLPPGGPGTFPPTGPQGLPPGGPGTFPPTGPRSLPPEGSGGFPPGVPGTYPRPVPHSPDQNRKPGDRPPAARPGGSSGVLLFLGVLALVGVLVAAGVAVYLSQQGGQRPPSDSTREMYAPLPGEQPETALAVR
ncbi:serine/threonine-protein kinase [Actinorugispora endophytica]|uniref:Serine/threonine protein kinase n=1 Tax=Actinorugispora endophytica TaxID=1605990 RepID=A0A4R6V5Q4_9ACTN|nr:serine/threonine-protein kinase [Actinorugispora endophytica]TDQ51524.1 serine/threonine protein kinase [Actinorugispora endophytica]